METFKGIIEYLGLNVYAKPMSIIFAVTLGSVYLFGRMLNIAKTSVGKNRVAAIAIFTMSATQAVDVAVKYIPDYIETFLFYIGMGCILYTIVGMRIFSRLNKLQNRVIADDDEQYDSEGNSSKKKKR